MKNYRITVDLQMDSDATATAFAGVLSKTMQITAKTAVDVCPDDGVHIVLGKTTIKSADTFEPN